MKKILLSVFLAIILSLGTTSVASAAFYFDINIIGSVTDLGNDLWLYEYVVSAVPQGDDTFKELSHWFLELPQEKLGTLSNFYLSGPEVGTFNEPALSQFFTGVKWESNQLITYSFQSTHGPVVDDQDNVVEDAYLWFAKSGKTGGPDGVFFTDSGRVLGPNGSHEGGGEDPVIPEPATLFLFGTGLVGAFLGKRRKI